MTSKILNERKDSDDYYSNNPEDLMSLAYETVLVQDSTIAEKSVRISEMETKSKRWKKRLLS